MTRAGFVLKVRPELMDDYRAKHEDVWPEMLDALRRSGWHNYTLFMRDDGMLFGYFETKGSFKDALDRIAAEPVNARWQELMAPYFEGSGAAADTMMTELGEVFHLD